MNRRHIFTLAALAVATPIVAWAAGGEKKKAGGESYLPVRTLLGMTLRGNNARGVLSVDCGLDVPDAALRARADQLLPRLRDSYVQVVQSYAAGLPVGALPNAEYLVRELQRRTNAILGKPGARVLLGAIIVN
jgi:flagellar basal body-associated protein FliL